MLGNLIVVAGLASLGLWLWKEKPRVQRVELQAGGRYRFTLRLHRDVFPGVPLAPFTPADAQLAIQLMQGAPQSIALQAEPSGDGLVLLETVIAQDDSAEIGEPHSVGDMTVTLQSVERV
jgi:hypothetical protein